MLDFNLTRFFRDQYLAEAEINTQSIRTNNFEHDRLWKVLDGKYERVMRMVSTKYTEEEYANLIKGFIDYLIQFDVNYNFSLMDPVEIVDIFTEWIEENNLNNPSPADEDDAELYEEDNEPEVLNDDVELKRKHDIKSAEELEKEYNEVIEYIANKIKQ